MVIIVCALVSKSSNFNKRLSDLNRKFLAIETELGAIFPAAQAKSLPVITIRGISDYADENKTELETSTSGSVRRLAASNAASFFKLQLRNPYVRAFIERRRSQLSTRQSEDTEQEESRLTDRFEELAVQIDVSLRQLSPALNPSRNEARHPD